MSFRSLKSVLFWALVLTLGGGGIFCYVWALVKITQNNAGL